MEKLPEFIANHLFLFSLLVVILTLLVWSLVNDATGTAQLSPAEATRLINKENAVIVDLRSADEYAGGHIVQAVHVSPADMERDPAEYRGKTVLFYCSYGRDSRQLMNRLRVAEPDAYKKFYCLHGGLHAWRDSNLPLSREQS